MSDQFDIYQAAKILIDQHGAGADAVALKRGEQLFDEGELEGAAIWRQIANAIEELQRGRRGDDR